MRGRRRRRAYTQRRKSTFQLNAQVLRKRVLKWTRLSHENVLPFRGVDVDHFHLALVYDWVGDSDVNQHIGLNPSTSRMGLVSDTLLRDNKRTNLRTIADGCRDGIRIPPSAGYSAWGTKRGTWSSPQLLMV